MGSDRAQKLPLFRTALPPEVGPAPKPPKALWAALALLDAPIAARIRAFATSRAARAGDPLNAAVNGLFDLGERLRDLGSVLNGLGGNWVIDAYSRSLGSIPAVRRARAEGLTAGEASRWAEAAHSILAPEERSALDCYVAECRHWEQRLDENIGSMAADPDWDMGSALRVPPSAPEAFLAESIEDLGIPMQAQVGVSRYGGRRQGGWFRAFWLDCAHRDVAFLLRLDVELDGATHRIIEGAARDEVRNTLLQARGWYILRVDSRNLGREQHYRAREDIDKLVRRHRRAIVLARTDFHSILV